MFTGKRNIKSRVIMSEHAQTEHHVASPGMYIGIFLLLMVLTFLTVWVATFHLPGIWNFVLAIAIAILKASLVVLYFMHLKFSPGQIKLVMVMGLFFLLIMLVITAFDYISRPWQSTPSGWTDVIR